MIYAKYPSCFYYAYHIIRNTMKNVNNNIHLYVHRLTLPIFKFSKIPKSKKGLNMWMCTNKWISIRKTKTNLLITRIYIKSQLKLYLLYYTYKIYRHNSQMATGKIYKCLRKNINAHSYTYMLWYKLYDLIKNS